MTELYFFIAGMAAMALVWLADVIAAQRRKARALPPATTRQRARAARANRLRISTNFDDEDTQ